MSNHDTQPTTDSAQHPSDSLSPAGLARGANILRVLHAAADTRRARRAARRTSLAAIAMAAGAAAVWMAPPARQTERPIADNSTTNTTHGAAPGPSPHSPTDRAPNLADAAPASTSPEVTIVTNAILVMGDCNSPSRSGGAPDVCLLNDDQLLAALAETGESYGLIRRGDRVEVVRNGP